MPSALRRLALLAALAVAVLAVAAAPASAFRLGPDASPIAGNPADRLAALPADPEEYDRASRCSPRPKPGTGALIGWLQRNARGVSWGSYRCEKWGDGEASLHAENRAVDWHLDVRDPADRAAARRLIELLLAPDRVGTPRALARRMGVEEIIWDCSYWGAGMDEFRAYSPCLNRNGDVRRRVNATIAHRDHLHLGLSKAGAAKRTSFWTAR
ncbi:MAG TPA: hypothetical protein VHF51_03275 [Solirubrobacteraceae bacterium]|nr:hypothetical protein [Solirubrobacteraceae bacterium]